MSSTFSVASSRHDARRHIDIAGMVNLRDVGGYPCSGGGKTRWRSLLRGNAPHRLTDECRTVLGRIGLRGAVDLRTPAERGRAPGAWGELPIAVSHRAILSGIDPDASLETIYQQMIDSRGTALAAAVVDVSRAATSPVLVHCSAGKDRTGMVIALILGVVGVNDADIVADYTLTGRYVNERTFAAIQGVSSTSGKHIAAAALHGCPPRLLVGGLARIRQQHGSVAQFLINHGASFGDLNRLRERLVTPADGSAGLGMHRGAAFPSIGRTGESAT